MRRDTLRHPAGFTLHELVLAIAIIFIIVGMAIPLTMTVSEQMRLEGARREVERELQTARLKSVSTNRSLQLRFGCPAAGQFRILQVMGTAVDTAANRCNETAYPSPSPSDGDPTTPDYDGPVRFVRPGTTLTGTGGGGAITAFQFTSTGTVREISGGSLRAIPPGGVNLTLTRGTRTATINVNGIGRIRIQ